VLNQEIQAEASTSASGAPDQTKKRGLKQKVRSIFRRGHHSNSEAPKSSELDEGEKFKADWLKQARAENQPTLESRKRAENGETVVTRHLDEWLRRPVDELQQEALFAPVERPRLLPASSGDAGASTSGAAPQVTSEQTTPEQLTPEGVDGTAAGQHPEASAIAPQRTESLGRELGPQAEPLAPQSSEALATAPVLTVPDEPASAATEDASGSESSDVPIRDEEPPHPAPPQAADRESDATQSTEALVTAPAARTDPDEPASAATEGASGSESSDVPLRDAELPHPAPSQAAAREPASTQSNDELAIVTVDYPYPDERAGAAMEHAPGSESPDVPFRDEEPPQPAPSQPAARESASADLRRVTWVDQIDVEAPAARGQRIQTSTQTASSVESETPPSVSAPRPEGTPLRGIDAIWAAGRRDLVRAARPLPPIEAYVTRRLLRPQEPTSVLTPPASESNQDQASTSTMPSGARDRINPPPIVPPSDELGRLDGSNGIDIPDDILIRNVTPSGDPVRPEVLHPELLPHVIDIPESRQGTAGSDGVEASTSGTSPEAPQGPSEQPTAEQVTPEESLPIASSTADVDPAVTESPGSGPQQMWELPPVLFGLGRRRRRPAGTEPTGSGPQPEERQPHYLTFLNRISLERTTLTNVLRGSGALAGHALHQLVGTGMATYAREALAIAITMSLRNQPGLALGLHTSTSILNYAHERMRLRQLARNPDEAARGFHAATPQEWAETPAELQQAMRERQQFHAKAVFAMHMFGEAVSLGFTIAGFRTGNGIQAANAFAQSVKNSAYAILRDSLQASFSMVGFHDDPDSRGNTDSQLSITSGRFGITQVASNYLGNTLMEQLAPGIAPAGGYIMGVPAESQAMTNALSNPLNDFSLLVSAASKVALVRAINNWWAEVFDWYQLTRAEAVAAGTYQEWNPRLTGANPLYEERDYARWRDHSATRAAGLKAATALASLFNLIPHKGLRDLFGNVGVPLFIALTYKTIGQDWQAAGAVRSTVRAEAREARREARRAAQEAQAQSRRLTITELT